METNDTIWTDIAAPLAPGQVKHYNRNGSNISHVDARDVFDRLNAVCPGEWSFTWELVHITDDGRWTVKGQLKIREVVQEDVGVSDPDAWGGPEKSAVSDAIKRCAYHLGFAIDEVYGSSSGAQRAPQNGRGGHWYDRPDAQQAFWKFATEQLGLGEAEVFRALGVETDIREFGGLMTDARNLLQQYASEAA